MTARRMMARLVAVVVLTASAGLAVTVAAPPAQAAACTGSGGVTVVVDPQQLGGAVAQQCSTDAGANAAAMFTGTGFQLTQVQQQPGFVCRINGAPSADPCVRTPPASAYWSLWWTDGTSSTWTYSSLGAYSLKVPAGGSVAFSWNQGGGNIQPGVAPARRAEASAPSSPAASASSSSGTGSAGGSSAGGSASGTRDSSGGSSGSGGAATKAKAGSKPTARPAPASPSASPSKPATARASNTPTPSATESAASSEAPTAAGSAAPGAGKTKRDGANQDRVKRDSAAAPAAEESAPVAESAPVEEAAPPEDDPTSSAPAVIETGITPTSAVTDPSGLPPWVGPGLLVVLLGAAGATVAVRRRRAID